jgi:hypothetical protein
MIDLTNINYSFNLIKAPINIRRVLNDEDSFIEWLNTGTIKDLECTLEAFENSEMYEDCAIIRDVIDFKNK